MTFLRSFAVAGVMSAAMTTGAAAATVSGSVTGFCSAPILACAPDLQPFDLDIAITQFAASDVTLSMNIHGDYNSVTETVTVSAETISLGTLFNNSTGDDPWAGPVGDVGSGGPVSLVTTLTAIDFNTIVADGVFTMTFQNSSDVNLTGDSVSVSLSYVDGAPVAPVPLPASGLFLIGAVGAMARMRAVKRRVAG